MSVYTSITKPQLQRFLTEYSVGSLIRFSAIETGVENTNYFIDTTHGEYVLTIYEDFTPEELPYFLNLMKHLSSHGVMTVTPVQNNNQRLISRLCDKPAALVERLNGSSVMQPTVEHCATIGKALARMHLAGLSYDATGCRQNHRSQRISDAEKNSESLFSQLSVYDKELLQEELNHYHQFDFSVLPQGIVHSDLFRDNCIFENTHSVKLSGIIDFYCACTDALLYDLAVTVNDWCFNEKRELEIDKYEVLIRAYHAVRPLKPIEKKHWLSVLRIAVLYFWVYRILFNLNPPEGECIASKDAQEFKGKVVWYLQNSTLVENIMSRSCH